MQSFERGSPLIAIDQVVPVRNQVAQRAALMAKRHTAVHAPGALRAKLVVRERIIDLEEVADALGDRPPGR
jgi:hypothetical protein